MDVTGFYDAYVGRQTGVGVNERHQAILARLRALGLRPGRTVLEIGCGVGTLTGLIAAAVGPQGSVVAVDLSPASIEAARGRLQGVANLRLEAVDVLEAEIEGRFDFVVLPDIVEHIPLERHPALFERVAAWVERDGVVLLNYPSPHYLEWCREHHPERLQIVDQPIHADLLLANAYPHGLYLDRLETYSVWVREGDYVAAVLRPRAGVGRFTPLPPRRVPLRARIAARVRRLRR